jgi:hypothetical protein
MYWWRLEAAKRELAAGTPGPRAVLPYLLAFAVLESVTMELSFLTPAQEDPASARVWLVALAGAAITALGCVYAYVRNGGAAGKQFLERLFVLGWVTAVRYGFFLGVGVMLFFGLVVAFRPEIGEAAGAWADPLFLLAALAYWLYLGHHLGRLARVS